MISLSKIDHNRTLAMRATDVLAATLSVEL